MPFTKGLSSIPTPTGPITSTLTTYSYVAQSATCPDGALTKPHAVTSAGSDTYCYDKNGNMVKRVENGTTYTQTFDAENRLSSVTVGGVTTNFIYDGDGNLVKKVKGTTTTVYVGTYEVELNSGVVTKKTSYYPGGAMRVDIVGGSNTVYYTLADHLGSASTLLDSNGNPVANGEQRYYPFGESRITSADLKTDHLFNGQRSLMSDLGIYHFGARMYSPKLGRFVSADTIVPEPGYPQALNRYAFVYNNPLKYVDPTGHEACYDTGLEIGSDISQADCWAYGADKWINGLDVATPTAGQGYNTAEALITNALNGAFSAPSADNWPGGLDGYTVDDVINTLKQSSLGSEIWDLINNGPGIQITLKDSNGGFNPFGNLVDIPDPNVSGLVRSAIVLAHEAIHVLQRHHNSLGMGIPFSDNAESEREGFIIEFMVERQLGSMKWQSQQDLATLTSSFPSASEWLYGQWKPYAWIAPSPVHPRMGKCIEACSWVNNLLNLGLSQSAIDVIYQEVGFNVGGQ